MLRQKSTLALLLATFTVAAIGQGCGSDTPTKPKDGGAGKGGTTGSAGTGGTTGTGGSGGVGPGEAGQGGGGAGGAATAGSDGGVDAPADAPPEVPPVKPDGAQGKSWLFDTSAVGLDGWHYTMYGSTPDPQAANNLAKTSTLVWDGTNDADNKTTSGSLKGSVPFTTMNEQIDFQAFTVAAGMYDWTGYVISAKVKLVSGGNLNAGCPLHASLYVSQAPDYMTHNGPMSDLPTGTWVTLQFDMADAGLDITKISQMGIQIGTGGLCTVDAGAPDGGNDAAGDAHPDGAGDVHPDGGLADAGTSDGGTDGGADGGTDGGADGGASDVVVVPVTATTAVILVDSVIVSVKP